MRKVLSLLFVLLSSSIAMSQDLTEMVKRDINAERRTIVSEAMDIPVEKETEFWGLYNDMEKELSLLMDQRVANIKKFADNYENVSEDVAHDLANTYFEINQKRLKIYKAYYKKIAKLLSKKDSSRFIQLMSQIQLIIDMQVAAEVPLIE